VPLAHLLVPSGRRFQRMVMPSIGLPLFAPSHLSQTGCGPWADCSTCRTLPLRLPLAAWAISTMDLTRPVSSSMVFQRPAALSEALAEKPAAISGRASNRVLIVVRMNPLPGCVSAIGGAGYGAECNPIRRRTESAVQQ